LQKVVYAGSNCVSFEQASDFLYQLAQQRLDAKTVCRTTERIGQERLAQRERLVQSWHQVPLIDRERATGPAVVPDLAVLMTDGGRVQILPQEAPGSAEATAPVLDPVGTAPTEPATPLQTAEPSATAPETALAEPLLPPPVPAVSDEVATPANTVEPLPSAADEQEQRRQRFWREDKVAALLTMSSEVHQTDPCPVLPEVFRDPLVVLKLAREVGHLKAVPVAGPFRSVGTTTEQAQEQAEQQHQQRQQRPGRPVIESRHVLATRQDNDAFGPMVAALAWQLGLMAATRRAFVADGADANWSIHQKYFPRFTAIVDFIHVLSYVFAAAMAGRSCAEGWAVYQVWIEQVWQGQVALVLAALRQRLGELVEGSAAQASVAKTLGYLEGQAGRMDYGRYRQEGLPIMSSIVESTVKQIGRRVKGSEKFWKEAGVEAVLQLRADYLSDDQPMEQFWQQRAQRMTGQRPYKRLSA
jgi:hypothetical protein